MIKWVNRYAPMYTVPNVGVKVLDIPKGSIVVSEGETLNQYERVYFTAAGVTHSGWVHQLDVEDYLENYLKDLVDIKDKTTNPWDFEQYILRHDVRQYNMCGELCIAHILNAPLDGMLNCWQDGNPTLYRRIFGSGKARGTGAQELIEMLGVFEREGYLLSEKLYEQHIKRARYTQKNLIELMKQGDVIVSCRISTVNGFLKATGVLHWVVIKNLAPERNGLGLVTIYNPAYNRLEVYSWPEMETSMGSAPYGIFVPRKEESGSA